ncbi:hypothetical protein NKR23_g12495 [Pleurostoma richardsiae]|uniref:Uncharacterized protein n=1 Tax=Pleurostoma richardsiae TaxID=41990 RepID=A0AA38VFD0_9PEZI|nr:hypothetical protein NKR23_g12495 [Pleurostoma richardsiae]
MLSVDADPDRVLGLAADLIDRGELRKAARVLENGEMACELALLRQQVAAAGRSGGPPPEHLCALRIERSIVRTQMGQYRTAAAELDDLVKKMDGVRNASLRRRADRWLATSLLLDGRYAEAAEEHRSILACGDTPPRDRIAVRTELALAHVYLGNLAACREALDGARTCARRLSGSESLTAEDELRLHSDMDMAEAKAEVVLGDYRRGVGRAETAVNYMLRKLGKTHMKTLECAIVKAHLLALDFDGLEAERVWRPAIGDLRDTLGNDHPQTLRAKYVWAVILRAQARLMEAGYVVKELCPRMEEILGADHPWTLDARAELAVNHSSDGKYATAGEELHDVIAKFSARYGWSHPSTLYCLSELARVCCLSRDFSAAEDLALAVLQRQASLYGQAPVAGSGAAHTVSPSGPRDVVGRLLAAVEYELELRKLARLSIGDLQETGLLFDGSTTAGRVQPGPSGLQVHPFLLCTLRVIAIVERESPGGSAAFARRIVSVVLSWKAEALGPDHSSTLTTEYELALAEAELAEVERDLGSAQRHFENAYLGLKNSLGETHPDALLAKRDFLFSSYAMSYTREDDLVNVGKVNAAKVNVDLVNVAKVIQERLGWWHPHAILSWVAVFYINLDEAPASEPVEETFADKIASDVLGHLRKPGVYGQRPWVSSYLQERIACWYENLGHVTAARRIREHIQEHAGTDAAVVRDGATASVASMVRHLERGTSVVE